MNSSVPQRIEMFCFFFFFFYGKEAFILTPVLPLFCLGPQDRRLAAQFPSPSRTFWIILSVALFFAVVGISTGGILGFSPSSAQVRDAARMGAGGVLPAALLRACPQGCGAGFSPGCAAGTRLSSCCLAQPCLKLEELRSIVCKYRPRPAFC